MSTKVEEKYVTQVPLLHYLFGYPTGRNGPRWSASRMHTYKMDAVNKKPEGNCALDFTKEYRR
jgi:hypothetical protein